MALGRMRAKQDRAGDVQRERGMVLLIHGDASFAGEGIMQETLNLSGLGGLHRRRHASRRRQQSDRLYDVAGRGDVEHLLHRRREDAADPDLSRERRGSRGRRAGRSPGDGFSPRAFRRDVVIDMYCYRGLGTTKATNRSSLSRCFTRPSRDRKTRPRRLPGSPAEAGRRDAGGSR